jgi:hypothetical protein
MNDICLHLLAAPEIEEQLLDQLLLSTVSKTFTSTKAASHGGHIQGLDPREQVLGRGDAVLIQVLLDAEDARDLIEDLRRRLPSAGVRFWLTPLLGQGQIG